MRKKILQSALVVLVAGAVLAGCGGKKIKVADLGDSVEPDRVLYEQAMEDMRRNQHTVARLSLQTLITTYPDSEYLAKAKLAIADSYFQEGGTSNLTLAVAEYKDFITFFPFLEDAAYAQYQVARIHYRRMEKPDRDRSQARLAELEFQNFILNYPNSELVEEARQRLREVQEVLAEGDFRVARYYYIKGNLLAAGGRLTEIVERYPLYSQADRALWMLGQAFERAEQPEIAGRYYARIVRDYPLSALVQQATEKLVAFNLPVPQPDPAALARMEQDRAQEREKPGVFRKAMGMFRRGPDVRSASRVGEPNMTPPSEAGGLWYRQPATELAIQAAPVSGGGTAAEGASAPPVAAGESSSKSSTDKKKDEKKEEKRPKRP